MNQPVEKPVNILVVGVGGQGTILASELLAMVLMDAGYEVKKSEVHGMAQRGGSVVAHLRYGEKVYSPLIEPGTADIELAFEILESVRYMNYLHKNSKVIVNTQKIYPPSVATGIEQYPDDILDTLRKNKLSVLPIDAFGVARELGEPRAVNMVIVGSLSYFLPIKENIFIKVIKERFPEKIQKVNIEAFSTGRELAAKK